MKKFKLLVLDDEIKTRRQHYEKILSSSFELSFIETFKDVDEIHKLASEVDALISDVYFDKNWPGLYLKDILEKLEGKIPVILVSSKWTSGDINLVTLLNDIKNTHNIIYFYSWSEFLESDNEADIEERAKALSYKVNRELSIFHKRTMEEIESNDVIRILHISDLQFGDDGTDPGSFLAENRIPNFLRKNKIQPHLIVISGDIASDGKPSDYKKAYDWITAFCKRLWNKDDFKDRIILVPGNHDFNIQFCSADQFKYNFGDRIFEKVEASNIMQEYQSYGLLPYREFAYKITGDIRWLLNENNLNWANEVFINWGIRFIQLNTVRDINSDVPDKVSLDLDALKRLSSNIGMEESVFNIVVAHHGPKSLGHEGDSFSSSLWKNAREFFETIRSNLFMYGHFHKNRIVRLNDDGTYTKRMITSMATTLTLSQKLRGDDYRRGFNIIELNRENDIVKSVKGRIFEISESNIREIDADDDYNSWDIRY